ncbi:MAG TPA: lysylphosphatidylglycerol synthase transmembrane domain-containing protein [Acidimicrobiia bacterium]
MTESVDTHAVVAATASAPSRGKVIMRVLMLVITGVALYLVLPGLIVMFGSLPQLQAVFPAWFVPIFLLEAAAFWCIWALMRIALHTDKWFDVACSQLTGNALSRALPGGAATGGATMYSMLSRSGFDGPTASTALTAVGLLSTATLFVLPILALPAILFGLAVSSELLQGAILGGVLGIFLLTGASILLVSDRVVRGVGHTLDWFVRRVLRRPAPSPTLADRLVESRDFVRSALAESWKRAVPAALGNQLFDFLALYVSLLAVGSRVDPVLVLLAFVAGSALAMIPITPGGLGFVEAGLTGVLALAGVKPDDAVLAVLLYRLFSYWLPLPAGLVASILFRRRHHNRELAATR